MWEIKKATLITNNDRVYNKYHDTLDSVLLDTYEDVLIKTRDMVYDRHILLTHPQAGSLKPNQTPYRSILVYPAEENDPTDSILLIAKCIDVYYEWQAIAPTPTEYYGNAREDFKTIDESIIDACFDRLQ